MEEKKRQRLIERSDGATLEGSPCSVAGWKNPRTASLSPDFGGFWRTSWETVERVLSGDKNFVARDVRFISWQWLGVGDEVPDALKCYC